MGNLIGYLTSKSNRVTYTVLLCSVLAVLTSAIYLQVVNHQFINLDDESYVTSNRHVTSGLTPENIIWAFTSVDNSNWHPITWLSHLVDVQFYGMNPYGHHLTNVVIHTLSALLIPLLLIRLTGCLWQSLFVAAMFALHPLHVESVAWVAERKDVLSAFFWFLTLVLYSEYLVKHKPALYILTLLSFMLGLMSKPMLVTLPVIMLLLDFWPLGRYQHNERQMPVKFHNRLLSLIKEKIPFFACSILSCLITIYAQHKGGAIAGLNAVSFQLRCKNALTAYLKYIGKTVWPVDLAIYYPISLSIPLWLVIGSFALLLMISITAIRIRIRHPYFAVGWFWFIVTLIPVIGLIQVGGQSMADRYSYIPLTGLFIMAAWGVPELAKRLRYQRAILALLAGAVIISSSALTWHQLGYWQDSISLYKRTLEITTGNAVIHYNLGNALVGIKGDLDGAIQQYKEVIRICPDDTDAHINMGVALERKGNLNGARQEYVEAIRIDPGNSDAHNNLGGVMAKEGNIDAAIVEYQKALIANSNNMKAYNNLGVALVSKGDLDEAIKKFREALRISPDDKNYITNLETALAQKKRQEEEVRLFSPSQLKTK